MACIDHLILQQSQTMFTYTVRPSRIMKLDGAFYPSLPARSLQSGCTVLYTVRLNMLKMVKIRLCDIPSLPSGAKSYLFNQTYPVGLFVGRDSASHKLYTQPGYFSSLFIVLHNILYSFLSSNDANDNLASCES